MRSSDASGSRQRVVAAASAGRRSCSTASRGSARRRSGRRGSPPRASRRRRARRASERGRGAALLRRADRPVPAGSTSARCRRRSGRRSRWRCCAARPTARRRSRTRSGSACATRWRPRAVLVAIDDIQWLDAPSAEALAFAARRLDGEPVGFLLARRPGEASCSSGRWSAGRWSACPSGRWPERDPRRCWQRLGLAPTPPRRIVDATLGNPLFALEVGAAAARPRARTCRSRAAVEDLLGTRVAALGAAPRRLLLAVALERRPASSTSWRRSRGGGRRRARRGRPGRRRRSRPRRPPAPGRRGADERPPARTADAARALLAHAAREPEQRALHLALATARPGRGARRAGAAAAARPPPAAPARRPSRSPSRRCA